LATGFISLRTGLGVLELHIFPHYIKNRRAYTQRGGKEKKEIVVKSLKQKKGKIAIEVNIMEISGYTSLF